MPASSTAETVLMALVMASYDDALSGSLPTEMSEYASDALAQLNPKAIRVLRFAAVRHLAKWKEARTLPGFISHIATRKSIILDLVKESGCQSLVICGAGFDGLGYLMADRCEVTEVDLAPIQERKRKIVQNLTPRSIRWVAADFADEGCTWETPDSDPASTLAVIEGVTMYLTAQQNRDLLDRVSKFANRVVVTHMILDAEGKPGFTHAKPSVAKMLKRANEPFRWGCAPKNLNEFLAPSGYEVVFVASQVTYPGLIPGEQIAFIRKATA